MPPTPSGALAQRNDKQKQYLSETYVPSWDKNLFHVQQQLRVMFLNSLNYPLGIYTNTTGTATNIVYDVKRIIGAALRIDTHGIILALNHPSGEMEPSETELTLRKKVKKAAGYFDIDLLDFLIVTENSYYSFGDSNLPKK